MHTQLTLNKCNGDQRDCAWLEARFCRMKRAYIFVSFQSSGGCCQPRLEQCHLSRFEDVEESPRSRGFQTLAREHLYRCPCFKKL